MTTLTTKRIEHNGDSWNVTYKIFGSEMRVYRVEGNITSPNLRDALQLEADTIGASLLQLKQ